MVKDITVNCDHFIRTGNYALEPGRLSLCIVQNCAAFFVQVVHRVVEVALAPLNVELDISGNRNLSGGLLRSPHLANVAGV